MSSKKSFADYLRDARLAAGLAQADVSRALNYSTPQFISNWERGISQPPVNVIKTLAKMYRVSAEEMFELMEAEIVSELKLSLQKKFKKA